MISSHAIPSDRDGLRIVLSLAEVPSPGFSRIYVIVVVL